MKFENARIVFYIHNYVRAFKALSVNIHVILTWQKKNFRKYFTSQFYVVTCVLMLPQMPSDDFENAIEMKFCFALENTSTDAFAFPSKITFNQQYVTHFFIFCKVSLEIKYSSFSSLRKMNCTMGRMM